MLLAGIIASLSPQNVLAAALSHFEEFDDLDSTSRRRANAARLKGAL